MHRARTATKPASLAALLVLLLLAWARPGRAAWRLAAFTGVGVTGDSNLEIREPERGTGLLFRDVSFDDKSLSFDSAPYYGWRVTRLSTARPWLAFAFEALHFKIFAETDRVVETEGTFRGESVEGPIRMDSFLQQYDVANGVNLLMLEGILRRADLVGGRLELYTGLGAGPTVPYTRVTLGGSGGSGHYELSNLGGQLFAGGAWRLGRRWDLFAEAKLTRTTVDGTFDGGESEVGLTTRHAVAGLAYRF